MAHANNTADLYVLAADKSIARVVTALLNRPHALGLQRSPQFRMGIYSGGHDGGCRAHAVTRLRGRIRNSRYALVIFDKHGCGHEHLSREQIQRDVEAELFINGWKDRAKAIVIDPELEAWVWQPSSTVSRVLGWGAESASLRSWLGEQGLWHKGAAKPHAPKAAIEQALRAKRHRRERTFFSDLASKVSVTGCTDPAFTEFKATLQTWFPRERDASGMVVRERAPVYEAQVACSRETNTSVC